MERATGLEPASGIPRMAGLSREPCRTSHLTRLRRRWRQRVLSLVGKSFSCTGNRSIKNGAGDGARTRYLHLGKVALYQMSYARLCHSPIIDWTVWCLRSESNQRHEDFQSSALPTELQRRMGVRYRTLCKNGDPERTRTVDLQRDRLAF